MKDLNMIWKASVVICLALCVFGDRRPAVSEVKVRQRFNKHHGDLSHIGRQKPEHHEEYAWSYPSYEFSYSVDDPHTHDKKGQHEVREKDEVKGYYWLIQPDGHKRYVKYHADDKHGFTADVHYSKPEGGKEEEKKEILIIEVPDESPAEEGQNAEDGGQEEGGQVEGVQEEAGLVEGGQEEVVQEVGQEDGGQEQEGQKEGNQDEEKGQEVEVRKEAGHDKKQKEEQDEKEEIDMWLGLRGWSKVKEDRRKNEGRGKGRGESRRGENDRKEKGEGNRGKGAEENNRDAIQVQEVKKQGREEGRPQEAARGKGDRSEGERVEVGPGKGGRGESGRREGGHGPRGHEHGAREETGRGGEREGKREGGVWEGLQIWGHKGEHKHGDPRSHGRHSWGWSINGRDERRGDGHGRRGDHKRDGDNKHGGRREGLGAWGEKLGQEARKAQPSSNIPFRYKPMPYGSRLH